MAWLSLIVILAVTPETYDEVLRLPQGVRLASLAALSALIAVMILGVVRSWRWTFWLMLVANLAGVLRVAGSALELVGVLPLPGPTWYMEFQAAVGVVQFVLGLVMLADYRRAAVWGRLRSPRAVAGDGSGTSKTATRPHRGSRGYRLFERGYALDPGRLGYAASVHDNWRAAWRTAAAHLSQLPNLAQLAPISAANCV